MIASIVRYIANSRHLFYNVREWANFMGVKMATRSEIGKALRHSRSALGYTQQALSNLTGVHKSTISEIENGHFTGSFDIFERLLDAVNLQFDISPKTHQLPDWDELDELFAEGPG